MVRSHLYTLWVMGELLRHLGWEHTHTNQNSTGYGQHGDYLFGWKDGALQKAMDQRCYGNTCTGLKTQTAEESTKCAVQQTVKEPVDGCK